MKKQYSPTRIIFLFFICFLFSIAAQAQLATGTPPPPVDKITQCGAKLLLDKTDPAKLQAFEQSMHARALERIGSRTSTDTAQYTIPIVFHVVHQNGPENISDTEIWDAYNLLNAAFKNVAPFDPSQSVNTNIDFCLAPSAIQRYVSASTNVTMETDDYTLKQVGQWDPNSYINIWVVNSINSLTMGPNVAGYAMMPGAHGSPMDGIVVESSFINNDPDDVKVLIHEMGHYLGLYHTFEGGCGNSDCMITGDRVCDTPPDNSITPVNCTGTANTCHSDSDDASINNPFRSVALGGTGDQPDMFQNYMDYGFQSCQTKFTDGQRTRMRDALVTTRHSLLEHPGLCNGCTSPIVASINLPDTLPAGTATLSVNVADTSLLIVWIFNGQNGTGSTITTTFPTAGPVNFVILVIDPSSPACNIQLRDTVVFTCPVTTPVLTATPGGLFTPGENISFTTPDNGYTYTWSIDGVPSGTGTTFNHVAGALGELITLEASNGTCKAVSPPYYIDPGNCANSKENNTWYFGMGGGINFNVSPPQAIQGKVYTEEGSAVISDVNGAPLFHSDGVTVGNSQTGFTLINGGGLTGNATTTQSALFVPMPGSSQYVYLFTVDYQAGDFGTGGGISYSIIDKLGDSGQGAVTLKNQLLISPVVEKVTAVKNRAGNGIWVLAHEWRNNAFYAWEITASGIGSPIGSFVGSNHTATGPYANSNALGEMKASPSGKKIAVAMDGQGMLEIFDFDSGTGLLSNPVNLQSPLMPSDYGVTFSPNERYVYVSSIAESAIVRFDLYAGSAAAITASAVLIGSNPSSGGAIQLAPDGKLYMARRGSGYLAVVSNPNAVNPADCGYMADGLRLVSGTLSFYGLPNPVQSILMSVKPAIMGPDKICLSGSSQTANYTFDPVGRATYSWIHHGPNVFAAVSDSSANMIYSVAGIDTLIVKRAAPCGDIYDTLYVTSGVAPAFSIGPDQQVCKDATITLDAGPGMFDYNWSNGIRNQTSAVSTAGQIFIQAITTAGCILRDTMLITNYTLPSLHLGRDTSICTAETITLTAPAGMDSYLWNTGATGSSIVAADSGRYIVTVGEFGCLFKDTILIRKDAPVNMITDDTLVMCLGISNVYSAPSGFDNYSWQLPSGTVTASPTVTISDPGYYILTYSNHCGTGMDSIFNYTPRFFSQDTVLSCADTIRLIAAYHIDGFGGGGESGSYIRHGDTVDIYRSGKFYALGFYPDVLTGCPILQYITVIVDTALVRPSMTVDLGPDTSYCEGNVLPLNAGSGFDWYHWNTGSIDSSITAYGFGEYFVNAHYCGYDYRDTIVVSNNNSVTVDLGSDISSCNPTAIILDAGNGYDWYEWNNGAHTQQINGSSFGQYSVSAGLNGCIARDTVMIIDCATAIPEKTDDCTQPFYLSPNPGIDVVMLGSGCSEITDVRVTISSSAGKILGEKEGSLSAVNVFMNQLMQHLSPAVYVIRVTNKNDSYYFKWMIIK